MALKTPSNCNLYARLIFYKFPGPWNTFLGFFAVVKKDWRHDGRAGAAGAAGGDFMNTGSLQCLRSFIKKLFTKWKERSWASFQLRKCKTINKVFIWLGFFPRKYIVGFPSTSVYVGWQINFRGYWMEYAYSYYIYIIICGKWYSL